MTYAAAFAYHTLFSFFPLILIVLSITRRIDYATGSYTSGAMGNRTVSIVPLSTSLRTWIDPWWFSMMR